VRLRLSGTGFALAALHGGTVAYVTFMMTASLFSQLVGGSLSLTSALGTVLGGLAVAGFGILFLIGIPFWLASVVLAACLLAGVQIAGRTSAVTMAGFGAVLGLLVGATLRLAGGTPDGNEPLIVVGSGVVVGLLSGWVTWAVAESTRPPHPRSRRGYAVHD
jgi:hypothetical protein